MSRELLQHKNEDLNNAPFSIKATPYVIGRIKEKELLIKFIKNGDVCCLTGPTGAGKSSLLLWIAERLKSHNIFYIDAANIESGFSIKRFLKSSRKGLDRLREYPSNCVILLDESQDCYQELQKSLKLHWDHNHIKSVVITQIEPGMGNFSMSFKDRVGTRVVRLGKINKTEAMELIDSRSRNKLRFDTKAMEEIANMANYAPRKIIEFCEMIHIKSEGKYEIKEADVKAILKKTANQKRRRKASVQKIDDAPINEAAAQITDNSQKEAAYEINKTDARLTLLQKKIMSNLEEGCKTAREIAENLEMPLGAVESELNVLCENEIISVAQEEKKHQ